MVAAVGDQPAKCGEKCKGDKTCTDECTSGGMFSAQMDFMDDLCKHEELGMTKCGFSLGATKRSTCCVPACVELDVIKLYEEMQKKMWCPGKPDCKLTLSTE